VRDKAFYWARIMGRKRAEGGAAAVILTSDSTAQASSCIVMGYRNPQSDELYFYSVRPPQRRHAGCDSR
jgi:hypothetical protein